MSTLVSAVVGVEAATSTCAVPRLASGMGDRLKLLLLELWPVGLAFACTGVLGGVPFGLLMDDNLVWSVARGWSSCSLAGSCFASQAS